MKCLRKEMPRAPRKVFKLGTDTREVVQDFPSVRSVAMSLGLKVGSTNGVDHAYKYSTVYHNHSWRKEENSVYSWATIAHDPIANVEFYFTSVGSCSRELFGLKRISSTIISKACVSGRRYDGFIFRHKNSDDGFKEVRYSGQENGISDKKDQYLNQYLTN